MNEFYGSLNHQLSAFGKRLLCWIRPASTDKVPIAALRECLGLVGKITVAGALILILVGCGPNQHELVGQPAPEFKVVMLAGPEVDLQELRGKPVLLEFWAPWCPGCLLNIPVLQALYQEYEDRISFIAPSLEGSRNAVEKFVSSREITYPVALADRRLINRYQVSVIPLTVLIDSQGIIRYYRAGQLDQEKISREINRLLK